MHRVLTVCLFASFCSIAACGGTESDEATPSSASTSESTSGDERETGARDPEDEIVLEGNLGSMSESAIESGIQGRIDPIIDCFADRYDVVDVLGGEMTMSFRVRLDGTVRWVYLSRSTVGDRATERCIVEQLSRIRFRPPHGGEAEFSWPLALDPPEDVRPPVAWPASRVADTVRSEGASLYRECDVAGEDLHVTVYVAPGGEPLAAGAAVDHPTSDAGLDCVAERVASWRFPDPGSYPAKVTFDLHP